MEKAFELGGKSLRTDKETLNVILSLIPSAMKSNDCSAVAAVLGLGLMTGRIVEMTPSTIMANPLDNVSDR